MRHDIQAGGGSGARHPAVAFVLPFAVFIALLLVAQAVAVPEWARFALSAAAILSVSLPVLGPAPTKPFFSVLIGIAVFLVWVGPDFLFPSWHDFPLFSNSITGRVAHIPPAPHLHDPVFLLFRFAVSALAVPILEELFWRGWLLRWLIDSHHFENVALGTYAPSAFWIVALLFASEHGSYWDVGLAAGMIYNWWLIRTRNLWDCILAHAVTNAVLAVYVVRAGQWQYWL